MREWSTRWTIHDTPVSAGASGDGANTGSNGSESTLEARLREVTHRAEVFERILRPSPAVLLVLRREPGWPIEYVSSNIDRLGLRKDEVVDGHFDFLGLVHPDDRSRVEMEIDHWVDGEDVDEFRIECRCLGTQERLQWMDIHLWSRRDEEGRVRGLQGVAWDITERKRAEGLQRLAVQVVELLNCPDGSLDIVRNILEMMRFYTGIEAAAIHLVQPDGGFRCIDSGFGTRQPLSPDSCPLVEWVLRRIGPTPVCERSRNAESATPEGGGSLEVTTGGSLWSAHARTPDDADTPGACPGSSARGIYGSTFRSFAVIPLRAEGEVVGILQLCDERPDQFDQGMVEAFEGLGYSIGIALERERTTERLKLSEERYRALFDTSSDGIAMLSLDHRIETTNIAFQRITGRSIAELRSLPRWAYLNSSPSAPPKECMPGRLLRDGHADDFEREIRRPDGSVITVLVRSWVVRNDSGVPLRILEIHRDISEQRRAEREVSRLVAAIEQSAEMVIITDYDSRIEYVNPRFVEVTGRSREEAAGRTMMDFRHPSVPTERYEELRATIREGRIYQGRIKMQRKDGRAYSVDQTISPVRDASGRITNFVAVARDVTEIARLEAQLLQAQKLESIGRLAAGIAHEINTPSQYVGDNVRFLKDAFEDHTRIMEAGSAMMDAARGEDVLLEHVERIAEIVEEVDLDDLSREIPRAIDQSLEGLSRISRIVGAMKSFSHPGTEALVPLDLHRAIESTVTVARNEWKYDAEVHLELDDSMPLVPCLPNEFNQVVLNLLINSVHAIQARGLERKGRITVRTRFEGEHAILDFEDDGIGIDDAIADQIFDPFFTTKDVGEGTGQGLALARDVIREKHGGDISFESVPGRGTVFRVLLPAKSNAREVLP